MGSFLRMFKAAIDQRPVLSNCLNYGSMAALAEWTQQTIERKTGSKKSVGIFCARAIYEKNTS
jgi:hypothetical protein